MTVGKAIVGIVRHKWSNLEQAYYISALDFYDEVLFINPRKVSYAIGASSDDVRISYRGHHLNCLSMVYVFGQTQETVILAAFLEKAGVPVSDPCINIGRNGVGKLADLSAIMTERANQSTLVIPSKESVNYSVNQMMADIYPCIAKPADGNRGRGLRVLHNPREAMDYLDAHFRRHNSPVLVERYEHFSAEYRVYLVDGVPEGMYRKVGRAGQVALNLHRGATPEAMQENEKHSLLEYLGNLSLATYQLGIYGQDVGKLADGGYRLIEVNRTPGFSGLSRLGDSQFASRVHKRLKLRAKLGGDGRCNDEVFQTITVLGDTNPGDSYHQGFEGSPRGLSRQAAYGRSFARFESFLAQSDFSLLNLEVCLTDLRESPFNQAKKYIDYADPTQTSNVLRSLGVDAVSLANNHSFDFGAQGLRDTIGTLLKSNVAYFGAGERKDQAKAPIHYRFIDGEEAFHFVFIAGFESKAQYRECHFYASSDTPGVNEWTPVSASEQVRQLRTEYPEATIVAIPHWGSNYTYVNSRQRLMARSIVEAGADLVIGHGAHALQEIEMISGRPVVYSLGNFVFNSPGRYSRYDVLPCSLMARMELYRQNGVVGSRLKLYPVVSDNKSTDYQPRPVDLQEFRRVQSFYFPVMGKAGGLEELFVSGVDTFGYYLKLPLNRSRAGAREDNR